MPDDDRPWCRATIAGGVVTLNPWTPALIARGPVAMTLERLAAAGVALADLLADGDHGARELVVRFVPRSPRWPATDDALLGWAQTVGYCRVWLPDRVVDLDAARASVGAAQTTCPTCRLEWRDDSPQFWEGVRTAGAFPACCPACGGSLPQWRAVGTEAPGGVASTRSCRERTGR